MATAALLLLFSVFAEGVVSSAVEKRLVSANPCLPTERLYHARVVYEFQDGRSTTCAGTLIHKQWVITASHCYGGPEGTLKVELGGHPKNVEKKTMRIKHANVRTYSPKAEDEPIMLLKLPDPVKNIVPAVIKPGQCLVPEDGEELMVSGRGATATENSVGVKDLMCLKVKALGKGNCPDLTGSKYEKYKHIFCGGATGSEQIKVCKGDSGSGVVKTDKVTKSSFIFWTKEEHSETLTGVLISGEEACEDHFVFVNICAKPIKAWIDSSLK